MSGWQIFSVKGQIVTIFDFEHYIVSVTATQFYCCIMKAATDSKNTNEPGCVLIKLYL